MGFRVEALGFSGKVLGFRVQGSGFRLAGLCLGFRIGALSVEGCIFEDVF